MGWSATILRLAAAALVSSVAAGILMVLLLLFGPFPDPGPGQDPGEPPQLELLIGTLRFGLEGAFILAAIPAFAAGASMWALGRRHPAARRPGAWAAAGACVGIAFFILAEAQFETDPFDRETSAVEAALCAAFLVAGAGTALAFRAAMWLTAPFPDERPSAGPS